VIDLEVEETDAERARERVDAMCRQLLTNPLIESYEIELQGNA
jgi:phosphoribosylformylglycinamidine synthase